MNAQEYRSRGGFRSARSLRPSALPGAIGRITPKSDWGQPSKDDLRDMLAEAARNTAAKAASEAAE